MVGPELINSNGGGGWCEHDLMGKSMGEEGWKYVEESPLNPFSISFPSHFNRLRRRKKDRRTSARDRGGCRGHKEKRPHHTMLE